MASPVQPAPAPAPAHLQPTHISVTFTIVTPDRLRRITFKLNKSDDSSQTTWDATFALDERADTGAAFTNVIMLDVDVLEDDHVKAAATAKHGMDSDQHAQTLAAADTAVDVKNGVADPQDAKDDASAIVPARSAASPV